MEVLLLIIITFLISISNGSSFGSRNTADAITSEQLSQPESPQRVSKSQRIEDVDAVTSNFDGQVYESKRELLAEHDDVIELVTVDDCNTMVSVYIPTTGLDSICKQWFKQRVNQGSICPDIYLLLHNKPTQFNQDNPNDEDYGITIPVNPGTIVYYGGQSQHREYYKDRLAKMIGRLSYMANKQKKPELYFYDLDKFNDDLNHNWQWDIMRVIGENIPIDLKYPEEMTTRGYKKSTAEFESIEAMLFPQLLCLLQIDDEWYLIPIWYSQSYGDHSSEDRQLMQKVKNCIIKSRNDLFITPSYQIDEQHKNDILPERIVREDPPIEMERD